MSHTECGSIANAAKGKRESIFTKKTSQPLNTCKNICAMRLSDVSESLL